MNSAGGGMDEVTLLPAETNGLRTRGLLAVASDEKPGANSRRPVPLIEAKVHDFYNSRNFVRVRDAHPEFSERCTSLNRLARLEVGLLNSFPMVDLGLWRHKTAVPAPQVSGEIFSNLNVSVAVEGRLPAVNTWCHGISAQNTGTGFCESLGIIAPLNENPLIAVLQERGEGVALGAAGKRIRPITLEIDGQQPVPVLFGPNHALNGKVAGYVAIAAGAFAPVNPVDFDFQKLAGLAQATCGPAAPAALDEYLWWNREQRKPEGIKVIDHPVEIAFFKGLDNIGLEAIH